MRVSVPAPRITISLASSSSVASPLLPVVFPRLTLFLTLMPTVSLTSTPRIRPLARRATSPSPTTRVVLPRTRSSAWSRRLRSTSLMMSLPRRRLRRRTALRTTFTTCATPSVMRRLPVRSMPLTRAPLTRLLPMPFNGSTATSSLRLRSSSTSLRRSRRFAAPSFLRCTRVVLALLPALKLLAPAPGVLAPPLRRSTNCLHSYKNLSNELLVAFV
mmetsp:Transcript_6983/g.13722  ORF Transcript_6983/g.13722 Transcript_6983/m.13722 type:complete len:216 (+) Transcript_6983:1453-2100(+)